MGQPLRVIIEKTHRGLPSTFDMLFLIPKRLFTENFKRTVISYLRKKVVLVQCNFLFFRYLAPLFQNVHRLMPTNEVFLEVSSLDDNTVSFMFHFQKGIHYNIIVYHQR